MILFGITSIAYELSFTVYEQFSSVVELYLEKNLLTKFYLSKIVKMNLMHQKVIHLFLFIS